MRFIIGSYIGGKQRMNRKKRDLSFLSLILFLFFLSAVFLLSLSPSLVTFAEGDGWTGDTVKDETGLSSPAELDALREEVKAFPVPVKILIRAIPSDQNITQLGKDLFTQYKLMGEELFILASSEGNGISVVAGKDLADRGLTSETIQSKLEGFYLPQAKQGEKITGITFLLRELQNDIKTLPPSGNAPTEKEKAEETSSKAANGVNWFTGIVLPLLLAVLTAFLLFYAAKKWAEKLGKNHRLLLTQLDEMKERLMARKVPEILTTYDEESRLRYESLKKVYADYESRLIPQLEEELGEAAERLSRYRLFSVMEILRYVSHAFAEMDKVLEQFEQEKEGLVRKEKEIPKKLKQAERKLSALQQNVSALSHRFGVDLSHLKGTLAAMEQRFRELEEVSVQRGASPQRGFPHGELDRFVQEMEALSERMLKSEAWVEEIEEKLPSRIKQLEQEMRNFQPKISLKHHEVLITILKEAKELWNQLIPLWDKGDLMVLEERMEEVKALLTNGEKILSEEREARSQIVILLTRYEGIYGKLEEGFQEDLHQMDRLRRKYQLDGDPILDEEKKLQQGLRDLSQVYQEILALLDQEAYTEAYDRAKALSDQVKEVEEILLAFHHKVAHLSLEEEVYLQEIRRLKNRLLLLRQQLDRSFLPGKQAELYRMIREGKELILSVEVLFDQLPIHLHKISFRLEEAKEVVSATERVVFSTIEQAKETEEIIRNLNIFKYRRPEIGHLLAMAENSYRDQNFAEAVEHARKARELAEELRA